MTIRVFLGTIHDNTGTPSMTFQFTQTTLNELDQALSRIEQRIVTPLADLSITAWMTREPVPFERRREGAERQLQKGDPWGGSVRLRLVQLQGYRPAGS